MKNSLIVAEIRLADPSVSEAVARISRDSRQHFLPCLPDLHSFEGDKWFFANRVFKDCQVWVAEKQGQLVGFCAFKAGWLDHLYLLPTHVRQGLGSALLDRAKADEDHSQLWVFQQNTSAIAFYENQGCAKVKETDGQGNEEQTPDALFEWRKLGQA